MVDIEAAVGQGSRVAIPAQPVGVRIGEAVYVVAVAASTAVAMSDPNHPRSAFLIAALVLALPCSAAALPVLYVAGSVAWNLTNADDGGLAWPVTATYVVVLGLAAAMNVFLLEDRRRQHLTRFRAESE
ncbi:MAG: hypothetical protein JWN99_2023 [Ilumatobacteraceae bacterium]|nr:hypothetical protein [Ilumatobacteraceae bacterium]